LLSGRRRFVARGNLLTVPPASPRIMCFGRLDRQTLATDNHDDELCRRSSVLNALSMRNDVIYARLRYVSPARLLLYCAVRHSADYQTESPLGGGRCSEWTGGRSITSQKCRCMEHGALKGRAVFVMLRLRVSGQSHASSCTK